MTSAIGFRAPVQEVSGAEAFDVFDRVVRYEMHTTGAQFLADYDRGIYDVDPDSVEGLFAVLTVLPFAR